MIYAWGGLLGSGKTLIVTMQGYDYAQAGGYDIYSNYDTTFTDEKINPLDLLDARRKLKNCVLLLDEAHTFLDSRISGRVANRLQGYFFSQTRKKKTHVVYDAQLLGAVDLRLRYISDLMGLASHRKWWEYFKYEIYYGVDVRTVYVKVKDAEPFFKMYNTDDVITPFVGVNIELEDVKRVFKGSPTKNAFISLIRVKYPVLTIEQSGAIYDFIKHERLNEVKQLLRGVG